MKLAIVGQGAIGSLFSYYWRKAQPSLLVRHLPSLPKHLHLLDQDESVSLHYPMLAIHDCKNAQFDTLLISVKCYQIEALIKDLKVWLKPSTTLVLVQNGMGGAQLLQQAFPQNPLVVGTSTDGVFTLDPNTYKQTAEGQLDIGFYPTNTNLKMALLARNSWLESFSKYHPHAHINTEIQAALFRKLAVNALINPLTATLNIRNGELMHFPNEVTTLKKDIFTIFDSMNVDWQSLGFNQTIDNVIKSTASNYSSMQQDVHYERKTEIDGVLGFLIQQGTKKDVKTPFLVSLYEQIKHLERSYNHH